VLLLLSFLFQEQLRHFLHFESSWPFVLLALAILVTVPFMLRGGILRGKQRFGLVSMGNLIGAGAKIMFSVLLVMLGLGTAGAIGGIVVAQIVACVFVAWWAFKLGLHAPEGRRARLPNMRLLGPELRYGLFVLIGSLAITLQYSLDIIIIKHYFDAHTAGLYAAISSVGRIIFFLTASISQVLISSVRMHREAMENNKQLLRRSLLLLSVLGLPALAIMALAPTWTVNTLMGGAYQAWAPLLPRLGLAIFIVSVLNLLISFHLALRHYGIAVATMFGTIFTYLLILWRHQTLSSVVDGLLWGSVAMLCLIGAWMIIHKGKGGMAWQPKH
jgi:O-antigen/teichoic acid export membrane protein